VIVMPILLALGLAAPAVAPAPAGQGAAAPEEADSNPWGQAPTGAAEDVALWTTLRDSQNQAVLQMSRIAQASYRIRYGRTYERLDQLSGTTPGPVAEQARRLRSRLEVAARQADEGIPKTGLRVRVCKYTLLHLDQRLRFPDDPSMKVELPRVRAEARSCTGELVPFAAKVLTLADALEAAVVDVEAFLDREEPDPPPVSAPASTPAPAPTPAPSAAPPASGASSPAPREGTRP
jgi:hypothetical protein